MRRKRAGCTRELAKVVGVFDSRDLALKSENKNSKLFAHRGRCRWLTVRAAKHRNVNILIRQRRQFLNKCACSRQPDFVYRVANRECIAEVIDVFASASEVCEFAQIFSADFG